MDVEIVKFNTVKEGLEACLDDAFTFAHNMDKRIQFDELWGTWLDSRTMQLYGGRSQKYDNRFVFKIDHEFALSTIVHLTIKSNGAISINEITYNSSTGTEFVVINKKDIKDAEGDFAIRADKYEAVREQLSKGMDVDALVKAGGFKVNEQLMPDEVVSYNKAAAIDDLTLKDVSYVHDGWLELAVGKNKANEQDYQSAIVRLVKYTRKAEEKGCFSGDGKGMRFYIDAENENFEVLPWYVGDSGSRSDADVGDGFRNDGRFLRVRLVNVGEADALQNAGAPQETDKIREAYNILGAVNPDEAAKQLRPADLANISAILAAYSRLEAKQ